jgi:hypothetical protein
VFFKMDPLRIAHASRKHSHSFSIGLMIWIIMMAMDGCYEKGKEILLPLGRDRSSLPRKRRCVSKRFKRFLGDVLGKEASTTLSVVDICYKHFCDSWKGC